MQFCQYIDGLSFSIFPTLKWWFGVHLSVTKGPADPAVRGAQIVVWMWDNLEKLNLSTSKAARFALKTHFFRYFTAT